jgi:hypothetical protein
MRHSKEGIGKGMSDLAHLEMMRKSIFALPLAHHMRAGGRYHRTGTPVPHGTEDHQPSDLTRFGTSSPRWTVKILIFLRTGKLLFRKTLEKEHVY